jgi:uncharacterized protein YjbI with pentapeptide repeats
VVRREEAGGRDWVQVIVTALPGIAAVVALVFASLTIRATDEQLTQSEQQVGLDQSRQITDRFDAAIHDLGSPGAVVELGGIYALQRIMRDSRRDQPAVVEVLTAYVRGHAISVFSRAFKPPAPAVSVQAALSVLAARNPAYDGAASVNLSFLYLRGADLAGASLQRADLAGANLENADLARANLSGANLASAAVFDKAITRAVLVGARLGSAGVYLGCWRLYALMAGADLPYQDIRSHGCSGLSAALLRGASLRYANLRGADLAGADLRNADMTSAELRGADLAHADLQGAQR